MKRYSTGAGALLALLISAGWCAAQTTSPTFETSVSTGIVGWVLAAQTAQLNVLNLSAVTAVAGASSTTATPACPVEIEFHDAQNNILKSLQVTNLAPGAAVSLTLTPADFQPPPLPTIGRFGIRGVVKYNSIVVQPTSILSGPGLTSLFSTCSIMTTLELYDNATGVTQTFTSDTRPFAVPQIVPLVVPK